MQVLRSTVYSAVLMMILSMAIEASVKDLAEKTKEIQVAPGMLFAVLIGVGILEVVAGYKLFKPTLFIGAAFLGGSVLHGIAYEAFKNKSYVDTVTIILTVIGALICGFLAVYLLKVGIFLLGAGGGAALAQFLSVSFLYKIQARHADAVMYGTMAILGIVFGLLAVKFQRPLLIAITSWLGATVAIRGVGYFAGHYPTIQDLKDPDFKMEKVYWAYFVCTIVLFLIGLYVQSKHTAKGVDHDTEKEGKNDNRNMAPPTSLV